MPYTLSNSKRIYYTDTAGEASTSGQNTLVFIHGLGGSSSFYFPIIPFLIQHGFRCITLDTYGSGQSVYGDKDQSIDSIAHDVIGALDSLDVKDNVVMVGHSMGGLVVNQIIATAKDSGRVKGAVLVGPLHPQPATASAVGERIRIVSADGMEPLANTIPYTATASTASSLVRAFIRELLISNDPEGYISLCRAIVAATVPDYASITVPLLVIAGEEDKSSPLSSCKVILNSYGCSMKRMEILAQTGHWHCLEAPILVQTAIKDFLSEISKLTT